MVPKQSPGEPSIVWGNLKDNYASYKKEHCIVTVLLASLIIVRVMLYDRDGPVFTVMKNTNSWSALSYVSIE